MLQDTLRLYHSGMTNTPTPTREGDIYFDLDKKSFYGYVFDNWYNLEDKEGILQLIRKNKILKIFHGTRGNSKKTTKSSRSNQ